MIRLLKNTYRIMKIFGVDLLKTYRALSCLPEYLHDLNTLKKQKKNAVRDFPFGKPYPCLGQKRTDAGSAKGHYFHQDLLVARRINLNNPQHHVDVGSRIDGFVAHVAAFRPIEVFDIRPLKVNIPNLTFKQVDFMLPLPKDFLEYCDSLSCLHALEHFGLGRYGDILNYDGYIIGLDNLNRILKKGGKLYFSVPIGKQRIEFNAHRVFSVSYLMECFVGKFSVDEFSFVDDSGDLHENTPISLGDVYNNYGCDYGCGIFELTKL
jgi:hypothetical protein